MLKEGRADFAIASKKTPLHNQTTVEVVSNEYESGMRMMYRKGKERNQSRV